ncbi:MAG: hypothetical protein ACRENP_19925 [Longimicrobiales bacterium]
MKRPRPGLPTRSVCPAPKINQLYDSITRIENEKPAVLQLEQPASRLSVWHP